MIIRPKKGKYQFYVCLEQAHDANSAACAAVHDVWNDRELGHSLGHALGDALGRLWNDKYLSLATLADAATMIDEIAEEELVTCEYLKEETKALIKMLEGAREFSELRRAYFNGK